MVPAVGADGGMSCREVSEFGLGCNARRQVKRGNVIVTDGRARKRWVKQAMGDEDE